MQKLIKLSWISMMCFLRFLLFPQNIVIALWSAVQSTCMVTTLQETDFISQEQLWITRASARTYLQAAFGTPRKKRLVVEVRETQTQKHREVI